MRVPSVRFPIQRIVVLAATVTASFAVILVDWRPSQAQAPPSASPPKMTLMGTLADWKYPGSKMLGGASMSDGGNPLVADVKCQAILTTSDPLDKVVKFYSERIQTPPATGGPNPKADTKRADAKAVSNQDDSKGRPVALRVIVVSTADTTTTLVISRAESEKETHIAWSHYRWFAS